MSEVIDSLVLIQELIKRDIAQSSGGPAAFETGSYEVNGDRAWFHCSMKSMKK